MFDESYARKLLRSMSECIARLQSMLDDPPVTRLTLIENHAAHSRAHDSEVKKISRRRITTASLYFPSQGSRR